MESLKGATTAFALSKTDSSLNAHQLANLFYLQIGTNDIQSKIYKDTSTMTLSINNIRIIIEKAKAKGIKLFVSNVLPFCTLNATWSVYNPFIISYNNKLKVLCLQENVVFLSASYSDFENNPGLYTSNDFIHPDQYWYKILTHEFVTFYHN